MTVLTSKNRILAIYVLLALVTLAAFWKVGRCGFTNYDDDTYVTGNSHVQGGLTLEGIKWAFTTLHAGNWHPLTWMSHMLDVQLFGLNPHWLHMINLLLHIANALLLFYVLLRMTKALWQSAFVAALFALHPLHVESVAWISERKDVLSTFFWMLTMIAYCRYVMRPGIKRYLSVFLLFALGLMAKPMLVTLPIVLLLMDYWPLGRFKKGETASRWVRLRPLLWEKIPLFVLSALSSAITYIAQQKVEAVESLGALPPGDRIGNALISYSLYIWKTLWPWKLAVFYPYPERYLLWQIAGAVLLLAAATWLALRAARRSPYLTAGWLWYMVTLLPVIGLVQAGMQARADRYTYIPLTGLFIMAAWGIPDLLKKRRYRGPALAAGAALALLYLFTATWAQISYWQNSIALWGHDVKIEVKNYGDYNDLGASYAASGGQALVYYSRQAAYAALGEALAYINRGAAYGESGYYKRAIEDFDRAISLNSKDPVVYHNRAICYERLGNQQQMLRDLKEAAMLGDTTARDYLRKEAVR